MGLSTAIGYATSNLPLEAQVSAHFSTNCFPPIPQACVPAAVEAIEAVREGNDDHFISLPEGVEHVTYGTEVPANVAIDGWHLDAWVMGGDDE